MLQAFSGIVQVASVAVRAPVAQPVDFLQLLSSQRNLQMKFVDVY